MLRFRFTSRHYYAAADTLLRHAAITQMPLVAMMLHAATLIMLLISMPLPALPMLYAAIITSCLRHCFRFDYYAAADATPLIKMPCFSPPCHAML